jgi:hypothetical protein
VLYLTDAKFLTPFLLPNGNKNTILDSSGLSMPNQPTSIQTGGLISIEKDNNKKRSISPLQKNRGKPNRG